MEKSHVALVYRACPICGKPDEKQSEVALDMHLRDISHLHKKVVGYGEPCDQCKEYMTQGVVLIFVDKEKTGEDLSDPWRTGQIAVMKEEAVRRIFGDDSEALKRRACFIDWREAQALGIEILPPPNE